MKLPILFNLRASISAVVGIASLLLTTPLATSANPVSIALTAPPHTMVAENVLIGVTEKGAVVSGRYRFRVTPDADRHWPQPYRFYVQLPVPIPATLKTFENIEPIVRPFMTIKGAKYRPEEGDLYFVNAPGLPLEAKLAMFSFRVERDDLDEEFELLIQYDQPLVSVGSKELVYYVPFLPGFEQYRKQMNLRHESFSITFEGTGPTALKLAEPVRDIQHSEPHLISVRPHHMEVIAVERMSKRATK